MNLAKARQIVKAHDEELRLLYEDWYSGAIPDVADLLRHHKAISAIFPEYAQAVQLIHIRKAELAMKRQRTAQARFGT
ncbi:MAG: hypothetical protein OXT70_01060 [Chloroflexota bacterium]|nr:hypothetical protein [Chloroflexota bacterium]